MAVLPTQPMKREYPDRPFVGVGVVIVKEGRVLLVRRGQPPRMGEWSIPGGLLELGETVRQAAVREAEEETGLQVETGELLGVFDRLLPDPEGRMQYHYVLIDFLCRPTGGNLAAGGDAAEARWFAAAELDQLALLPDTAGVIHLGLEKARQK